MLANGGLWGIERIHTAIFVSRMTRVSLVRPGYRRLHLGDRRSASSQHWALKRRARYVCLAPHEPFPHRNTSGVWRSRVTGWHPGAPPATGGHDLRQCRPGRSEACGGPILVEWPLILLVASVSSSMILARRLNAVVTSALVIGFVPIAPLSSHLSGPGSFLGELRKKVLISTGKSPRIAARRLEKLSYGALRRSS